MFAIITIILFVLGVMNSRLKRIFIISQAVTETIVGITEKVIILKNVLKKTQILFFYQHRFT
jgi:hypothetical protein